MLLFFNECNIAHNSQFEHSQQVYFIIVTSFSLASPNDYDMEIKKQSGKNKAKNTTYELKFR